MTPVEESFDSYRDRDPQVENHGSRLLGVNEGDSREPMLIIDLINRQVIL